MHTIGAEHLDKTMRSECVGGAGWITWTVPELKQKKKIGGVYIVLVIEGENGEWETKAVTSFQGDFNLVLLKTNKSKKEKEKKKRKWEALLLTVYIVTLA